jgi:hypothetical protein
MRGTLAKSNILVNSPKEGEVFLTIESPPDLRTLRAERVSLLSGTAMILETGKNWGLRTGDK